MNGQVCWKCEEDIDKNAAAGASNVQHVHVEQKCARFLVRADFWEKWTLIHSFGIPKVLTTDTAQYSNYKLSLTCSDKVNLLMILLFGLEPIGSRVLPQTFWKF